MTRPSTGTSHIGRPLDVAAMGGVLFCAALVTGLAGLIPAGVAAGVGGGGFVLWLAGVRELIQERRLRERQRADGT